jgi:hypothetical protein
MMGFLENHELTLLWIFLATLEYWYVLNLTCSQAPW